MKSFIQIGCLFVLGLFVSSMTADTFRHKTDGSTFTGFATQKMTGGKTLVFNSEESKMVPLVLSDYDVRSDKQGRRDYAVLIQINKADILLSKRVSETVAAEIVNASNTGPQAIILEIDNPGGLGEYMKIITAALSDTNNCPVIAYISGRYHGGAFSAASILALACEKVFIHPSASIGSVGTVSSQSEGQDFTSYLRTYCPDSLVHYGTYAASVAQKNGRPEGLAQALLDKRLPVVEVAGTDGSRHFILEKDRQPTQTLIRTLTEGADIKIPQYGSKEVISPADVVGKVLSLTANDAVAVGLADETADGVQEVLAAMGISEASIRPDKGIDKVLKKFYAGRRNIDDRLLRIENLEDVVNNYDEQFKAIDSLMTKGTQIRQVPQDRTYRRNTRNIRGVPDNADYYDDVPVNPNQSRRNRVDTRRKQSIIREEPVMDIRIVYDQLTGSRRDLVAEYRRVINLAKKWPGGLPVGVTVDTLQRKMDSAENELDKLYRYTPVYPPPVTNYGANQYRP